MYDLLQFQNIYDQGWVLGNVLFLNEIKEIQKLVDEKERGSPIIKYGKLGFTDL